MFDKYNVKNAKIALPNKISIPRLCEKINSKYINQEPHTETTSQEPLNIKILQRQKTKQKFLKNEVLNNLPIRVK